ncbi:hypothetical protein Poly51_18560 [Rubripirellula tenax]|uniref:DNA primase small subunit n=1 Tax=Rubripirellula tenax TaxID=2528015 RepID=A0A5C6FEN7_9BACT|nr:DNA primase [Rubripirellula tenax]TWU59070.1 hypothetical protein Poly51_18560 [Rubripirellula tenax]
MINVAMPLGYRIVGPCDRERKLVDYDLAFAAYADCDDTAKIDREAFLSSFQYDDAIRERANNGAGRLDVRGFDGPCWSRFVWFDIDRADDINAAKNDAFRLASLLVDRYEFDDSELLVFFSGSKGFHVGLPTSLFNPMPAVTFNASVRNLAEKLAGMATCSIDSSIYGKVQPLRAPNSRHGKTGRYKRLVALPELFNVQAAGIVERAANPLEFEIPDPPANNEQAMEDWRDACEITTVAAASVKTWDADRTALNRSTLEFIRDGVAEGERQRRLFSAAANLAEFGCPPQLAHALLTDIARDIGLTPSETRRTIDSGLTKGGAQ